MSYTLGPRSRANLAGVHPDLVRVVERAIQITRQDFFVVEGVRWNGDGNPRERGESDSPHFELGWGW